MSEELWTSPLTGYRRRGTRVREMRALFGATVTAEALLEPLQACRADAHAQTSKAELCTRAFDVAGVREHRDGPLLGIVARDDLEEGHTRTYVKEITTRDVVSEATPLGELFVALADREYVLVMVQRSVAGIITRADLNKPPVRVYLFGLVSLIEMHLAYWVRTLYPDDAWRAHLSESRIQKAEALLAERAARNEATPLLACLQFCDKREILIKHEPWRLDCDLGSKARAKEWLEDVESLRNTLAHSQPSLAGRSGWSPVITLVQSIEGMLERSDSLLEQRAVDGAVLGPML
jgi:hypothetical protein